MVLQPKGCLKYKFFNLIVHYNYANRLTSLKKLFTYYLSEIVLNIIMSCLVLRIITSVSCLKKFKIF